MTARRLAWSLWGIAVAGYLGIVAFAVLNRDAPGADLSFDVVFGLIVLLYPSVGALVAARFPRNPIGWLLLGAGLLMYIGALAGSYALYGLETDPGSVPGALTGAWVSSWLFYAPVFAVPPFLFLLVPDGRLLGRRWRLVAVAVIAGVALILPAAALDPDALEDPFEHLDNPYGTEAAAPVLDAAGAVGFFLVVGGILASVVSLVLRYRRLPEQRQQLKWILVAGAVIAIAAAAAVILFSSGQDTAGGTTVFAAFGFVPVAAGIAVLRHRLYDIDLVINRALVYGALTAILASAYLGLVLLLGLALGPLTSESDLAIALSTLAVAALFQPARRRVQTLVDRRFYRRKYDAARILEGFGARLRSETDLDALRAELTGVVHETMQPAHVSLWLREGTR
jgi:hypothetical protein